MNDDTDKTVELSTVVRHAQFCLNALEVHPIDVKKLANNVIALANHIVASEQFSARVERSFNMDHQGASVLIGFLANRTPNGELRIDREKLFRFYSDLNLRSTLVMRVDNVSNQIVYRME